MDLNSVRNKRIFTCWLIAPVILFVMSLFIGRYPLSAAELLRGNSTHLNIFMNLRLGRALTALFGGFALGVSGFVFQCVFRNPLASPDVI